MQDWLTIISDSMEEFGISACVVIPIYETPDDSLNTGVVGVKAADMSPETIAYYESLLRFMSAGMLTYVMLDDEEQDISEFGPVH